ncbi:helix-turn-helix transcriptional regulator [Alkaliphilus pronyensis]|uniref:Helix-turn-helix transcriptional regulator n=1 Tax=Alkaliphilus pronyensis TaxID=1482732 RepID=A0A6I0F086_9FIRM|nr:helix-turn-helix transcriptional regulator [Alkaliphilus pronyensis]KAB3533842.1 helix-turn-helix transcriptional regulator [Alkaliphilus pronyensis]
MARQKEPTYITEEKPFPKALRELMEETKTTQPMLAKAIGVTRQAISLYCTGQSTPNIDIFVMIADYFNVSFDYLLGRSAAKNRENIDIQQRTGLSEGAIENICMLTNMLYSYKETNNTIEFTLEPKDILNELITSASFAKLIFDLAKLMIYYSSTIEVLPLFNCTRIEELPDDASSRYNYRLWRVNVTAQKLISEVLDVHYKKTKDGINTFVIHTTEKKDN